MLCDNLAVWDADGDGDGDADGDGDGDGDGEGGRLKRMGMYVCI